MTHGMATDPRRYAPRQEAGGGSAAQIQDFSGLARGTARLHLSGRK
jgi:hypothetical protein